MRVGRILPLMLAIGLMLLSAGTSWAGGPPTFRDMLDPDSNEVGFTLDGFLQWNIWQLAQSPLSPETMSRVNEDIHKAPHRGVQVELLSPGDFGVTVHLRW